MLAVLLLLRGVQGLHSTPLQGYPPVQDRLAFDTVGDVRREGLDLECFVGPDAAEIAGTEFGLVTNLVLRFKPLKDSSLTLVLHSEEGEDLLKAYLRPDSMQLVSYSTGQNATCKVDPREDITTSKLEFALQSVKLMYEGAVGAKECVAVAFQAWGTAVGYRLIAGAAKPGTIVTIHSIEWDGNRDMQTAVAAIALETKTGIALFRDSLQSTTDQSDLAAAIEELHSLSTTLSDLDLQLQSLTVRWQALKSTDYMTRPEHLIHHFRLVLRDLDKEVSHLYGRITTGALSEYAERFIHERKEVMPMEVLLGAYAWQIEKKLGELKTHIASLSRFNVVFLIGGGVLLAALSTVLMVRKAEKLHKL